jgi:hypothetical protein
VNPFLKGRMTRLRHSAYPVDLLIPQDAQEAHTLSRRRSVQLGNLSVWVCGPEDLILLKLKAGDPAILRMSSVWFNIRAISWIYPMYGCGLIDLGFSVSSIMS